MSNAIAANVAATTSLVGQLEAPLPPIDTVVAKHHGTVGTKRVQVMPMEVALLGDYPKVSCNTVDEIDAMLALGPRVEQVVHAVIKVHHLVVSLAGSQTPLPRSHARRHSRHRDARETATVLILRMSSNLTQLRKGRTIPAIAVVLVVRRLDVAGILHKGGAEFARGFSNRREVRP